MLNFRSAPTRHPGLEVETIQWAGSGLIRGVASSPDGLLYILRGPCVYFMPHHGQFELYAGNPARKSNIDGNRLAEACFEAPNGLHVTSSEIYVCDTVSSVIRCISGDLVSTYAGSANCHGLRDGPRVQALFNGPSNVVLFRETLFVSDYRNNAVRMISADGIVSSIGGKASFEDGPFRSASFDQPSGLCISPSNTVIVADSGNRRIRSIDMDEWSVTTIAGGGAAREDGSGASAGFGTLSGVTSSFATGELFLVDFSYNRIRCIDSDGNVSTLTGSTRGERDGPLATARLLCPDFCCLTPDGTLYWTEYDSSKLRYIRELSPQSVAITSTPHASFEYLLETGFSSDFEIIYQHTSIPMHSHILLMSNSKLKPEFIREKLADCTIDLSALKLFLQIAYGASQLNFSGDLVEIATTYAEFLILFHLLEYEQKWVEWCQRRLAEHLLELDVPQLFSLILKFAQDAVARESLIIPVITERLKTCKSEAIVEHRKSLYPLASIDLDMYSMIVYQITGASPVPAIPTDVSLDYLRKDFHHVVKQLAVNLRWKHARKSREHHHSRHASRDSSSTAAVNNARTPNASVSSSTSPDGVITGVDPTPPRISSPPIPTSLQPDPPTPPILSWLPSPNFTVSIIGNTGNRIKVHDWMMYSRWGFFRRMCDAGLAETKSRTLLMPSDFPPALLLELTKCIYCGVLPQSMEIFSVDACWYLLEHALEFDLVDLDREPRPLFKPLVTHCRTIVFYPLTIANVVAKLCVIGTLGSKKDLKAALNFVAANLEAVTKTPSYHQDVDKLPGEICKQLLAIK